MVTEIHITRLKNSVAKTFIFEQGEIKTEEIPQVSKSASLGIAKDDPTDTTEPFVINLGSDKLLTFEWVLYKQDNDRSVGTQSGEVKTYEEMLNYLEDVIGFPGIGIVDYTITITDKFRTRTAIYSLEDFKIDVNSSIRPKGNFKFKWKRQVV